MHFLLLVKDKHATSRKLRPIKNEVVWQRLHLILRNGVVRKEVHEVLKDRANGNPQGDKYLALGTGIPWRNAVRTSYPPA